MPVCQKVLGANLYVCKSYRGKTDSARDVLAPPSGIGLSLFIV